MMLEWGNQDHVKAILDRYPEGFDYVIGADIYILAPGLTFSCSKMLPFALVYVRQTEVPNLLLTRSLN
jgi:hypothetical protein